MGDNKKTKAIKITVISLITIILIFIIASYVYIQDYYHAESQVMSEIATMVNNSDGDIAVYQEDDGRIALVPDDIKAGIIFYPGGKVESEAYYPLLEKLAEKGYLCVLLKVRWNLAVMDINKADGIIDDYPDVKEWYVAGHSLGGSVAAMYVNKHEDLFDGLILLGSYSTENISDTNLKVLSIYGSEDGVLNRDNYAKYAYNLPYYEEHILDGGCHAYFGNYGPQKGDGEPKLSVEEQQNMTADIIDKFVSE